MARIDVFKVGRGLHIREQGVRLEGAAELDKALAKMEAGARAQIIEEGVRAGGEVFREGMSARAADHAEMAAGIEVQITTEAGEPTALIGPRRGKARGGQLLVSLAYWREFGTKAHTIIAGARAKRVLTRKIKKAVKHGDSAAYFSLKDTKTKRALASSSTIFGASVDHPGTLARPFIRPAFDEDGPKAQSVMGRTVWSWLKANAVGR